MCAHSATFKPTFGTAINITDGTTIQATINATERSAQCTT
jgi:hypothetical protein